MSTALRLVADLPRQAHPAGQGDLFVLHGRRLRAGCDLGDSARFTDDVWSLAPASLKSHERRYVLDFGLIPPNRRQVAKDLCYAMLSGPLPPGEDRPAVLSIRTMFTHFGRFLRWTADRAPALAGLTGRDLEDFQRYLATTVKAGAARHAIRAAARKFWIWRHALPSDALSFDPRHIDGWGEPKPYGATENATARIPEPVLGPLFAWAIRFIDDFSADIISADRHWRTEPARASLQFYGERKQQLKALLDHHIATSTRSRKPCVAAGSPWGTTGR